VSVEATIPEASRRGLAARGHDVMVVPPRTHVFGYGQAVMSDGTGVHFGASEPRHDGARSRTDAFRARASTTTWAA
jgi:hypothetical protein